MDSVKIFLENGVEQEVPSIFYVFNSKYYFIYTTKELDENGYVILYVCQVGKETANSTTGIVETGNMVGVEITDPQEWANVQSSITEIISDKKNKVSSPKIQYLPLTMLVNLKIVGKKVFRLKPTLVAESFGITVEEKKNEEVVPSIASMPLEPVAPVASVEPTTVPITPVVEADVPNNGDSIPLTNVKQVQPVEPAQTVQNDVVIDYRTSFFEEQEKNKSLQSKIDELTEKLNSIKKLVE